VKLQNEERIRSENKTVKSWCWNSHAILRHISNWLFRTWTGKRTGSTSPCGNTQGLFGLPSIPKQRSFQGQEIAFITWYLVYFLCTFQCQAEVTVGVDPSIGWDVVSGKIQASIFHERRILCIMNPSRTTATQTQARTHAHSQKVFISVAISIYLLNFSFTFYALCLGSLLPAKKGNQETFLRLPPIFFPISQQRNIVLQHT